MINYFEENTQTCFQEINRLCRDYNGFVITKYYGDSEIYSVVLNLTLSVNKEIKMKQSGDSLKYCLSKLLNMFQEKYKDEISEYEESQSFQFNRFDNYPSELD